MSELDLETILGEPEQIQEAPSSAQNNPAESEPSPESYDLAQRISERFGVNNRFDILAVMHNNLKLGAAVITLSLIFRWLTILKSTEDFSIQPSIFLSLAFDDVASLIIALSVCWVIFNDSGMDSGNLLFSLLAGAIMIFSVLYVCEPIVMLVAGSELNFGEAVWRSLRLVAIGGGVTFGTKLLMDALKLRWLKAFLDGNGLQFNHEEEADIQEA